MPQRPRPLFPERSPFAAFGAELRAWRTLRRMSQARLGDLVHFSGDLIGKVEKAERRPSRDLVARLDAALETRGALTDAHQRALVTAPSPLHQGSSPDGVLTTYTPFDGVRVGAAQIQALGVMAEAFAEADHCGGGQAIRQPLEQYVISVVTPLLRASCPSTLRPSFLAVSGRLLDIAGFVAFDAGDHQRARRAYRESLHVLEGACTPVLTGHVLTDWAMLAVHSGEATEATQLATAAAASARRGGSPTTRARALAVLARAQALAGEVTAARRSLDLATCALSTADPDVEPPWVGFFTTDQLEAESVYALRPYASPDALHALAATSLEHPGTMRRRHLLVAATLASACLTPRHRSWRDVHRACALLTDAAQVTGFMASARVHTLVQQVVGGIAALGTADQARTARDAAALVLGVPPAPEPRPP